MSSLLIAVTVGAVLVAVVTSVVAWRVLRDERTRSAARVATLIDAAQDSDPRDVVVQHDLSAHTRSIPEPEEVTDRFDRGATFTPAPAAPLFESAVRSSGSGLQRRLALAASVLLVGLLVGAFWNSRNPSNPASTSETTTSSPVPPPAPLALLSMEHERQGTRVRISGVVRRADRDAGAVTAIVQLFDGQGAPVARAEAALPGDATAPFSVVLDAPATAGRYNVTFRNGRGLVPHVDRRGPSAASTRS